MIVAISNDGVAGMPGVLRLTLESRDGRFRQGGSLDGGHPHAGKIRQASFLLPHELDGGSCVSKQNWRPKEEPAGLCAGPAPNP